MKFILLLLISTHLFAHNKVVYGKDNRKDIFEVHNYQLKELARSTAAMVKDYQLIQTPVPQEKEISGLTLAMRGVCSDQRFAQQISAAACSGFLIARDILVTAGHCIQNQNDCEKNRWIFDFAIFNSAQSPNKIKVLTKNIYSCKQIISQALDVQSKLDYAIIRLDRPVTDRSPLIYRTHGKLTRHTSLFVIGHPSGLPTKIADHASVHRLKSNYFVTNLDTFGGNSGSPVFNRRTLEVEGILVRGDIDYQERQDENCLEVNFCKARECKGEEVTRITSIPTP